MSKVIIFTNENGGVSVCMPTDELPIENVMAKDCPEHAIVVDHSILPQEENDFFNAWRLNNGIITVDLEAARSIQLAKFNAEAAAQAILRRNNSDIGIPNSMSDNDFISMLNSKREAIAAATSTAELRAIGIN